MTDTMHTLDVVIVGGCGHVGLPLGIMLAQTGLQVGLLDTDEVRREQVRSGRMPFLEYGADEALGATIGETLHVVDGPDVIAGARHVVITIGTPIDEYLNPQYEPLFTLAAELAPHLAHGQHLILRSTVFPGTTREFADVLENLGLDVELSYCPERIAQGYALTELDRLPQIVSGLNDESVEAALGLFRNLTERTIVVTVEEAELAKLYLNAWRYIQFSIANQFFMMAEQRGLDYFRIHEAMVTGYSRADDFPLPGFTAGPCLLKDTMQLAGFDRNSFHLGNAAMLVNEGLPAFIVGTLQQRFDLRSTTVGILGMAFKGNVDDTRDSLAFKLRKLLAFRGATVLASDAFADDPTFVDVQQLLADSDVIVLGAPHAVYRELHFPPETPVVDVWGFLRASQVEITAP